MNEKRFVIGDVLGFGWQVMKANFWFFVGVAFVGGFVVQAPNIVDQIILALNPPEEVYMLLSLVLGIVGAVLQTIVGIGVMKIALSFCDGRKPFFGTLFDFQGCFWRYLGAYILYTLIIMGGFLLFIVPGVIWSIKYGMCYYFVVDKGLGPVQAIKASGRMTMGVKGKLLEFGLLCSLIILLGFLCLGVGVFAAFPVVLIANALVYRHLLAQTPGLEKFGIAGASPEPDTGPAPVQAAALDEPQSTEDPYQRPPNEFS